MKKNIKIQIDGFTIFDSADDGVEAAVTKAINRFDLETEEGRMADVCELRWFDADDDVVTRRLKQYNGREWITILEECRSGGIGAPRSK